MNITMRGFERDHGSHEIVDETIGRIGSQPVGLGRLERRGLEANAVNLVKFDKEGNLIDLPELAGSIFDGLVEVCCVADVKLGGAYVTKVSFTTDELLRLVAKATAEWPASYLLQRLGGAAKSVSETEDE